jgi:hypothetical protein
MCPGASVRRRRYRLALGENRKSGSIRWIGGVSVGEMRMMIGNSHSFHYLKADEGAEKSFRKRRRRGSRRGKKRSRVGKTRSNSNLQRPDPPKSVRKSKRVAREQSWCDRRSSTLFDKLSTITKKDGGYMDFYDHDLRGLYRSFYNKVVKMSSLGTPITYHRFWLQMNADTPWVVDPDICLRVSVLSELDLTLRLSGTNISIPSLETRPFRGVVAIGSLRKNTRGSLCLRCGRRSREDRCTVCDSSQATSSSATRGKKGKTPARVRRCGCKVGAKCPH